jgi:hypothetical protein
MGKLEPFNEKEDDWASYVERLEMYFVANDVKEEKKVAVFISSIGSSTYALLRSLLSPAKPSSKSFEVLCDTLQKHLSPLPITIAERFRFYKRDQRLGESISEYIAELKKMSSKCEFGLFLQEALRDKLVCGLRDTVIQQQLLTVDKLTFEQAAQKALMMEQATADVKELHVEEPSTKIHAMHQESRTKKTHDYNKNCKCCGRRHPGDCWHKDAVCNKCGENGHIVRACTSQSSSSSKYKKGTESSDRTRSKRGIYKVDEDDNSSIDEVDCNAVSVYKNTDHGKSDSGSIMLQVLLNGKQHEMELDTGSAVSLMSYTDAKSLFQSVKVQDTSMILKTYTGERIKPRGTMDVRVQYGDQCRTLPVVIINGNGPSLFGRDWLKHIQLNWQDIKVHYTKVQDAE